MPQQARAIFTATLIINMKGENERRREWFKILYNSQAPNSPEREVFVSVLGRATDFFALYGASFVSGPGYKIQVTDNDEFESCLDRMESAILHRIRHEQVFINLFDQKKAENPTGPRVRLAIFRLAQFALDRPDALSVPTSSTARRRRGLSPLTSNAGIRKQTSQLERRDDTRRSLGRAAVTASSFDARDNLSTTSVPIPDVYSKDRTTRALEILCNFNVNAHNFDIKVEWSTPSDKTASSSILVEPKQLTLKDALWLLDVTIQLLDEDSSTALLRCEWPWKAADRLKWREYALDQQHKVDFKLANRVIGGFAQPSVWDKALKKNTEPVSSTHPLYAIWAARLRSRAKDAIPVNLAGRFVFEAIRILHEHRHQESATGIPILLYSYFCPENFTFQGQCAVSSSGSEMRKFEDRSSAEKSLLLVMMALYIRGFGHMSELSERLKSFVCNFNYDLLSSVERHLQETRPPFRSQSLINMSIGQSRRDKHVFDQALLVFHSTVKRQFGHYIGFVDLLDRQATDLSRVISTEYHMMEVLVAAGSPQVPAALQPYLAFSDLAIVCDMHVDSEALEVNTVRTSREAWSTPFIFKPSSATLNDLFWLFDHTLSLFGLGSSRETPLLLAEPVWHTIRTWAGYSPAQQLDQGARQHFFDCYDRAERRAKQLRILMEPFQNQSLESLSRFASHAKPLSALWCTALTDRPPTPALIAGLFVRIATAILHDPSNKRAESDFLPAQLYESIAPIRLCQDKVGTDVIDGILHLRLQAERYPFGAFASLGAGAKCSTLVALRMYIELCNHTNKVESCLNKFNKIIDFQASKPDLHALRGLTSLHRSSQPWAHAHHAESLPELSARKASIYGFSQGKFHRAKWL
ncbi:hypothetical protein OIV83_005078 [Microbotryomycetes sp. JL201]|nr:hypothetical protein OIV83_005078 [Microbotryomycetes sp. JL201]